MFNPSLVNSVLHMFFATLETSLFVVGGISAWYILKRASIFSMSLFLAAERSRLLPFRFT